MAESPVCPNNSKGRALPGLADVDPVPVYSPDGSKRLARFPIPGAQFGSCRSTAPLATPGMRRPEWPQT
jgi:hypothetical protein